MKRMIRELNVLPSYHYEEDFRDDLYQFLRNEFNPKFKLLSFENQTGEAVNVTLSCCYFSVHQGTASINVYFEGHAVTEEVTLELIENDRWIRVLAKYGKGQQKQTELILNKIEESLSKFTY